MHPHEVHNLVISIPSLLDTLPLHLEASYLDPSPDLDEFPDDIILAQTAALWKYIIIEFQAKQRLV